MSNGRVSAHRHPAGGGAPKDSPESGPERHNHLPKRRYKLLRSRRRPAAAVNQKSAPVQSKPVDIGPFTVDKAGTTTYDPTVMND